MQVYNTDYNQPLEPGLQNALETFRAKRNFNAKDYVDAKAALLNDYYRNSGLKTATVLLSGGIDSSVVAGIVSHAMKQPNSPIENLVLTTMPANLNAATGQNDAAKRAHDVMNALGCNQLTQDVTSIIQANVKILEETRGVKLDDWAIGQIVAHARTFVAAGNATIDAMQKSPGLVVGTTNRSEGAYLGYVGKWSDGMVDIQLISDALKSEVYEAAYYLNLPKSTIDATPKGDMYDARDDVDVFGASYDFVELYHYYLELSDLEKAELLESFNEKEHEQFSLMANNLENLHRYNAHKYQGNQPGSPAYHLDVMKSGVPGGWADTLAVPQYFRPTNPEKIFNGYFELSDEFLEAARKLSRHEGIEIEQRVITATNDIHPKTARILKPLIPTSEAVELLSESNKADWVPAGLDGYKLKTPDDTIGSWRATAYSPEYAEILWDRIKGKIPMIQNIAPSSNFDAHQAQPNATVWRPVGINPALRFIKYDPKAKNLLFPHYDGPPTGKNTPNSLDSLVIYLTNSKPGAGGETAFIADPQAEMPELERDLQTDWMRIADDGEIITAIEPIQGLGMIFPHRALHSSQALDHNAPEKVIVRTDIIYDPVVTP